MLMIYEFEFPPDRGQAKVILRLPHRRLDIQLGKVLHDWCESEACSAQVYIWFSFRMAQVSVGLELVWLLI